MKGKFFSSCYISSLNDKTLQDTEISLKEEQSFLITTVKTSIVKFLFHYFHYKFLKATIKTSIVKFLILLFWSKNRTRKLKPR